MYRDVAQLIVQTEARDADGYPVKREMAREVFADVQSVKRSEFYAGKQMGLELAVAFRVRTCDYDGEKLVEYAGKRYRVERVYSKDGELTELNCSEARE